MSTSLCLILFNQSHAIFWEFIGIQNPLLPKFSGRFSENPAEKSVPHVQWPQWPRFALPTNTLSARFCPGFQWTEGVFLRHDPCRHVARSPYFLIQIVLDGDLGLTPPIQEHVNMSTCLFNDKEVSRKKTCIHACIHTYTNIHTYTHTRIRTYTCPCRSVYSSLMQFGNVKTYQAGLQNVKSTSQPVRT